MFIHLHLPVTARDIIVPISSFYKEIIILIFISDEHNLNILTTP
jgi:hypothetical protein